MIDRFRARRILVDAFDRRFRHRRDRHRRQRSTVLRGNPIRRPKPCSRASPRAAGVRCSCAGSGAGPGHPRADAVLAAITTTLAWGPLMRKRISRLTAESLPWWMTLFGTLIGASADASRHRPDRFCDISTEALLGERSLTEIAFAALLGIEPSADDLFAFQDADRLAAHERTGRDLGARREGRGIRRRPRAPERVQLNKALIGFLTHTGYTHGGNGYEGIAFLIERSATAASTIPQTRITASISKRSRAVPSSITRSTRRARSKPAASTSPSCRA